MQQRSNCWMVQTTRRERTRLQEINLIKRRTFYRKVKNQIWHFQRISNLYVILLTLMIHLFCILDLYYVLFCIKGHCFYYSTKRQFSYVEKT